MSDSTRSLVDRTGPVRLPASPIVFAAAAVAQRVLANRRRKPCAASTNESAEEQNGQGSANEPAEQSRSGRGSCRDRRARRDLYARRDRREKCGCGCCSVPRRMLSVGLTVASVGVMVASSQEMTRAGTTMDPHAPEGATALVTSGPFAISRNPIYLGWAGLLVAHAIWLGSRRAFLPAGAFVLAMNQCQIPLEEAALEQGFGKKYRKYADRVPRWVLR